MEKQNYGYGCGLYAVANSIGIKTFVTNERLERSKAGVNNGQLNIYLQEDGYDIFIDVLYCDTNASSLPDYWTGLISQGDNEFMPILIQCLIGDKFHLMGARLLKEHGKIELFDSLKNEPVICTLSEVNKMYEKVCAIYSFNHLENNDYVFF